MEDVVHSAHGGTYAARIANVADIELELGMVVALAHVILLFLVSAENANFRYVGMEKAFEDGIAKRSRPSRYKQNA
ncbi:hypothetical protein D3C71_1867720 [compost metagenome]